MDYTGQSLDRGQDGEPKLPEQPLDTDFAKKFPPDPTLGDEIGETARVWKVYRAEAEAHDNTMLDGWNKTLDVLLIFAGLFSAVATAFLIDSYKLLQPDDAAAYMSTALYLLVMQANVSSEISLPPPPPLASSSSTMSRAVNWLWFTSLLLSLSVALLGILIKQWIVEYNSRNTASAESPRHWTIRHRMFFHAMVSWPVSDLVSVLPVMLHASLFLFFGGVAIFVWDLDVTIGIWITILGLLLAVFYMACTLLPLWIPECPTSTPLVHLVRRYFVALQIGVLQIGLYFCTQAARVRGSARSVVCLLVFRPGLLSDSDAVSEALSYRDHPNDNGDSYIVNQLMLAVSQLRASQKWSMAIYVPRDRVDTLTADALLWLMFSVADSDASAVGMQALGAVPSYGALAEHLRRDARLDEITAYDIYSTRSEGGPVEDARTLRSMLWSRDNCSAPDKAKDRDLWGSLYFTDGDYLDMLFLRAVAHTAWELSDEIPLPPLGLPSPSISSTVLLFLRARYLNFTDLVTALLWCDFDELVDADWTFVLERIVSEGSTRTSILLLPSNTPLICIADVLAQCVMQNDVDRNNATVHRLLISLLTRLSNRYEDDEIFVFSSFLSAYLVSELFAEQQMETDVLQSLISTVLIAALRVAEVYLPATETYFHLLNSFLPLLWQRECEVPDGTCLDCAALLAAYNAPERVRDGQVLSLMLRRMLMPTERQPLRPLWDLLRNSVDAGHLTERLSLALCVAQRAGEDVSGMVTILLRLSLRDLLYMFRNWSEDETSLDFVLWVTPIVQCFVDLSPRWWFDSLSAARENEGADNELQQYMSELEAIPLYRGPCEFCHKLPLGWDDDDDDDPVSSCRFNPASRVLSQLPHRLSTPDVRTPWYCSLCAPYRIR